MPATTSAASGASADAHSGASAAGSSFLDKFRYATPEEESQVLWKRWPN